MFKLVTVFLKNPPDFLNNVSDVSLNSKMLACFARVEGFIIPLLLRKKSTGIKKNYQVKIENKQSCKLLVVGGGCGGCSIAARFVRQLGKNSVIIVEPCDTHMYQPLQTLVGAGVYQIEDLMRPMKEVLPGDARWIQDSVQCFDPDSNMVYTSGGVAICYDYLVISTGIQLKPHKVEGLVEALSMKSSGVCSNYFPVYAEKTFRILQNFKEGNAVFTFPNTPVKCAGAPLKVLFLSENYLDVEGKRNRSSVYFKTPNDYIFTVKHYEKPLLDICETRNLNLGYKQVLVEVKPERKEAVFEKVGGNLETVSYEMLHVTPPMGPTDIMKDATDLTNTNGYVTVNKSTLQHTKYSNVFAVGDCTDLPTSKTAAAISSQGYVLTKNLFNVMSGKAPEYKYNGYTACPILTRYGYCILAEFDYKHKPRESLPFDQRKESRFCYFLKKEVMPQLYWICMKGYWNGPEHIQGLFNFKK